MNRLTHTLTFFPNSPSIIMACPDEVPVTDEAIPEERGVTLNHWEKIEEFWAMKKPNGK
jgi:hypothetical protein